MVLSRLKVAIKYYILIVTLFVVVCHSFAQTVATLELYIHDPCNNEVSALQGFLLKKKDWDTLSIYSGQSNAVDVPSFGLYELSLIEFRETLPFVIYSAHQIDTLTLSQVKTESKFEGVKSEWKYYCCDSLCDGAAIKSYPTGQPMMVGYFSKGKPINDLFFFDIQGRVVEVRRYSNKGKLQSIERY